MIVAGAFPISAPGKKKAPPVPKAVLFRLYASSELSIQTASATLVGEPERREIGIDVREAN